GSANTLAPQIEFHAIFICPIFSGPYFHVFGRPCGSEAGKKPGAYAKAGALEDRAAGMVGLAHGGLPERLPWQLLTALFLASYQMTASGAVHSPRDLSSARGRDSAIAARGVRGDTPKRRINGRNTARGGAFFPRDNRLEPHRPDAERRHYLGGGRCSF